MSGKAKDGQERVSASALSLLRRFYPFVRAHLFLVICGLVAIPLISVAGIWRPLLVKSAVDQYIPAGDYGELQWTAVLFFGAVLVEYLCTGVQMYCLQRAEIGRAHV